MTTPRLLPRAMQSAIRNNPTVQYCIVPVAANPDKNPIENSVRRDIDGDGDLEMGDLETEKCGDGPANIIEGR